MQVPSDPVGPWFPAFVPAPQHKLADLLDACTTAKHASTMHKYHDMAEKWSAAWFCLSSNKEADEWGSCASISVEGLRCPGNAVACTSLSCMLLVTRDFFVKLHCPEPLSAERLCLQTCLLAKVSSECSQLLAPCLSLVHSP